MPIFIFHHFFQRHFRRHGRRKNSVWMVSAVQSEGARWEIIYNCTLLLWSLLLLLLLRWSRYKDAKPRGPSLLRKPFYAGGNPLFGVTVSSINTLLVSSSSSGAASLDDFQIFAGATNDKWLSLCLNKVTNFIY